MSDPFDILFGSRRESRFLDQSIAWVPQEAMPSSGEISPYGFIEDDAVDTDQIADEAVGSDQLAAGALEMVHFADGIIPPRVEDELPALPDADWPVGSIVFLTTDEKLYRVTADDEWVSTVPATDLTGQIVETQITDAAITTVKIEAGAITADLIEANAITSDKILANAVTAGKIDAGAVGATELAAEIVLASLLKTSEDGCRVEISDAGILLLDDDEVPLVKIPTDGNPVYVKGEITTSSLISEAEATLYGVNTLPGESVTTLASGVAAPTNAPSLTVGIDSLSLGSTPEGVATAAGIAYDSAGGSFWVAADPTAAGGYVAHEYDKTTGDIIRSIEKTGSSSTETKTSGAKTHVADYAEYFGAAADEQQIACAFVMPEAGTITKVAVWMAGKDDNCSTRTAIWTNAGTLLGYSTAFWATGETFAKGASTLYNKSLQTPVNLASGSTYKIGFLKTASAGKFQYDVDYGSGTLYRGEGYTGDFDVVSTESSRKINAYITYTVTTDTTVEDAPMIGVCVDADYVYTLDDNGVLYKYDIDTLEYVTSADLSAKITGNTAGAGLFYDATAAKLVITTADGTTGTDHPRFVLVLPDLTWDSTITNATHEIDGDVDSLRGGARLNDPLNADTATYWVPISGTVYAYKAADGVSVANRTFGTSTTVLGGLTHDGTVFRGWAVATPTKIYTFSAWDFTDTSTTLWVGYAWYDITGATHETVIGPRSTLTVRRRERVLVTNAALPTGTDVDRVRIYALQAAADGGAGTFWLQVTDALTSRYLVTYTGSGTHDGAGTAFDSGTPAELKSAAAAWSLKGDGTAEFEDLEVTGFLSGGGASFPASPADGDRYWRTDLDMQFFYDGTRWVSTTLYQMPMSIWSATAQAKLTATTANCFRTTPPSLEGGSNIWCVKVTQGFYVYDGTNLSGSHKWVVTFVEYPSTATFATVTIDSGAETTWRVLEVAVGAAMTAADRSLWTVNATKTGTPGDLLVHAPVVSYRIIAT